MTDREFVLEEDFAIEAEKLPDGSRLFTIHFSDKATALLERAAEEEGMDAEDFARRLLANPTSRTH